MYTQAVGLNGGQAAERQGTSAAWPTNGVDWLLHKNLCRSIRHLNMLGRMLAPLLRILGDKMFPSGETRGRLSKLIEQRRQGTLGLGEIA